MGKTRRQSKATRRESPCYRWTFTLNNYTETEYQDCLRFMESECKYGIVGKEIGDEGTPHLQGYFSGRFKYRLMTLKHTSIWTKRAHLENAKGATRANYLYCSKEGDFKEFGKKWIQDTIAPIISDLVEEPEREKEIINDNLELYAKNYYGIENTVKKLKRNSGSSKITSTSQMHSWQRRAMDKLKKQDDRKILFIVDREGGRGKTTLARYLARHEKAFYCQNAKTNNIACGYNGEDHVVFDLCRSIQDGINWSAIEMVKNGIMFSGKYQSSAKFFDPPKMVVMMNQMPDMFKLSADRYVIMDLDNMIDEEKEMEHESTLDLMDTEDRDERPELRPWPLRKRKAVGQWADNGDSQ